MKSPSSLPPAPHATKNVDIPGFSSGRVAVQQGGAFGSSKLFIDGQLASPTAKKGRYILRRDDGSEVEAHLKNAFLDPTPVLLVDSQTIRIARPLTWSEWAWAGFPLVLIFLGGAIGGGLGALAMTFNVNLMRSEKSAAERYAASAFVTIGVIGLWLVIVSLIRR